jgi:hypothetical protein
LRLFGAISCLLLAAHLPAQSPRLRVIDRLAAVVNGEPLFASQVRDDARFARLSLRLAGGRAPSTPLTPAERSSALHHLEDDVLLAQARANEGFPAPPAAQLQTAAQAQWRHWQTQAGGAARLLALLAKCGLRPAVVLAIAERQLSLVAFLDQRFSGDAPPSAAAIEHYYAATFVPESRARGLRPAPLTDVRRTIATLLRQRRRAAEEQALLGRLRAQAVIEVKAPW